MAESIGRLGSLGIAIEAVPGTPEATVDIFIPFTENSLRGHHEPLFDQASRRSRVSNFGSVQGKKWGEGSVTMYLDSLNCGYLFKLGLGQEAVTLKNATPPVYDHLMIPTVSGNAVTAATLWDSKVVDTEQYSFAAVDTLELEVMNDGIATITAGIMAKSPSSVSAPAQTTTSGTLYTWKDMNVRFGSTVAVANAAAATKLTNFKLSIANNVELTYKSGSNNPDTVLYGECEVTGSYTLYFESITDRNNYMNLLKQSMVVTLTGASLGSGFSESLTITLKKVTIQDIDYETGTSDFFTITANFTAEWDQDQAGFLDVVLRNGKSTTYS